MSRSGSWTRSSANRCWQRCPGSPSGFSAAAPTADHALDYVKAPLFDFTLGRVLPPSGHANSDDLQDLLSLYLDQCKAAGGELFAFGAKFDQNLHKPIDTEFGNLDGLHGIHDIHMNQGNVGQHAGDNAVSTTAESSSSSRTVFSDCSWASRRSKCRPTPRATPRPVQPPSAS